MTREQEGGQIVGGCCGSMAKQNCIKEDIFVTVSFSIEEKKNILRHQLDGQPRVIGLG